MRISVLARGGFSVFDGYYDPHRNEAVLPVRDGETSALVVEYPSAPTSPSIAVSGAGATATTISGNKLSTTLSGLKNGGRIDVTATVGGETRIIRVRVRNQTWIDRYDCWPDFVGP